MSIPEENIGPSPRTTTTCTDSSYAASRNASPSARTISPFIALRFSARVITTWRTGPRSSVATSPMYSPGARKRNREQANGDQEGGSGGAPPPWAPERRGGGGGGGGG